MTHCSSYYDEIYSGKPDKWNILWRDEQVLDAIDIEPESIIDIGCGNGHTLAYLQDRLYRAKCYGVDYSEKAVEIAKKNAVNAKIECKTFDEVDNHYEVAILMGVMEHLEDLDIAFSKLRSICDKAYIECPNCLAYSDSKEEGFRNNEWHLTRDSWEKHIAGAGFEITKSIVGKSKSTEFAWVIQ